MHDEVRDLYDAVATAYAEQFLDELSYKPTDRAWLDDFAATVPDGPILDLGCGPGQIARYLHERGREAWGVDLSLAMVEEARRRHPGLRFLVGDMRDLPLQDGMLAGIAAFYSLIHLEREEVVPTLRELWRVLVPGGGLLLAVHAGEGVEATEDALGSGHRWVATMFRPSELVLAAEHAGLELQQVLVRDPEPQEHPTRRLYLRARRRPGHHNPA